jgi:serine/threonine protein phosphatase PrpC
MEKDTRYSGSTCVSVLTLGKKLYIANVGDSRAILITCIQDNNGVDTEECSAIPLTRDHKPDDPDEAERII